MSLSRIGEDAEWFGERPPGYVYIRSGKLTEHEFNNAIRTPTHFCELAMRALEQSGELSDEELEACEKALRERFSFVFDE